MKRKASLKPRSQKRQSEGQSYTKRRRVFLLKNGRCFRCLGVASDIHHYRGSVGRLYLDERFWKPACRHCHDWIHQNSRQAREMGYLAPVSEYNIWPGLG